jgi:hypothetical protein
MSDELIEKMCEAQHSGSGVWLGYGLAYRRVQIDRMRCALAVLAKPENISVAAGREACITLMEERKKNEPLYVAERKAIAASIQSLLKTD